MNRRDLLNVTVIGFLVGLFVQPVLVNLAAEVHKIVPVPAVVVQGALFIFFVALAPIALAIAAFIGKKIPVVYQFAKFGAVGSLNSFIDFGVLNILIYLTDIAKGWPYSVFVGLSFLAATTNSYFWNKHWTFQAAGTERRGAEAAKFYSIAIAGAVVSIGVASFIVNAVAHPGLSDNLWANVGKLAGIFSAMLFNFAGYKFVVFKKPGTASSVSPSL